MSGRLRAEGDAFDVVVLGSALPGAITAACLARGGASVVLMDADTHPRFTMTGGEWTSLAAGLLLHTIGARYEVPEVRRLASFEGTFAAVSTTGGIARHSAYVRHREGARPGAQDAEMTTGPSGAGLTRHHLFRQDTDNWMTLVAARYGAEVRQQQRITELESDGTGVTVRVADGPSVRARYVVGTGGGGAARLLGAGEAPAELRARTRSLGTHMIDVRPFQADLGQPVPWHEGTLHHAFPGGLLQIVPYDNHPRSTNPLCSTVLRLDAGLHPPDGAPPEEEFRSFVERFPALREQFASARPVRGWVRTASPRFAAERAAGERWCLTPAAAGCAGPLHGWDLTAELAGVHTLVHRVLAALAADDFAAGRFEPAAELAQRLTGFTDELTANAFASLADDASWRLWRRASRLRDTLVAYEVAGRLGRFLRTARTDALSPLERPWWSGRDLADSGPAVRFLQRVNVHVRNGRGDAGELLEELAASDWLPPAFGLADPAHRWTAVPGRKAVRRWAASAPVPALTALVREGHDGLELLRGGSDPAEAAQERRTRRAARPLLGRKYRVPAPG